VAAAFYDGPGWTRFRSWENLFLTLQGGWKRARRQILTHLPDLSGGRVLEVGIGDGANLPLLPEDWQVDGVDIARSLLVSCAERHPMMRGRLAWAEAEALPYDDATFDATYTIGGFNYFGDHERTLAEMRRVTKPGGTIVVADEVPWLARCGIGSLCGLPALDGYWMRALGLDREFAEMVIHHRFDVNQLFRRVCPDAKRHSIWHGLGYCMVDRVPPSRTIPTGETS